MVARITPRMQDQLLQLLLAVSEGRGDEAAAYATRLGEPRAEFRREDFTRRVRDLVADHQEAALRDLQVGRLVLQVTRAAAENGLRLPAELMMLGKTFLNLDEIARRLDPEFTPQGALRAHLSAVLQRRVASALSPATVFGALIETKDLAERLPGRLNRILDGLADSDMRVHPGRDRSDAADDGTTEDREPHHGGVAARRAHHRRGHAHSSCSPRAARSH
jgi:ubiquinone biosynthesis protein